MTRFDSSRGFTLVELLIAMAVFAVMAAMAYGGLSSVISTRRAVSAALDRSKTLQMALWRIRNDVEQAVNRPIRDQFGDTEPALLGSPQNGLTLTRDGWSNPLGEIRSNLQRVRYHLDDHNNLVRDYWPVLDRTPDSTPVQSTLLPGVESMEWRFLDAQRQWQDRWPPTVAASGLTGPGPSGEVGEAPPLAIELRLDTQDWGKLRLLLMVPGARTGVLTPSGNPPGTQP